MVLKSHTGRDKALPSVFEKFDGIRPMAAKLGVPTSTVKSWHKNRHIPAWRHRDIIAVAKRCKLDISADELSHIAPDEISMQERRRRRPVQGAAA